MSLLAAEVRDASGKNTAAVRFDQSFVVDVAYRVNRQIQDAAILLRTTDLSENIVFTSLDIDSGLIESPNRMPGAYVSSCTVPKTLLKPGRYWMSIGCHVPNGKRLDYRENVVAFDVGCRSRGLEFRSTRCRFSGSGVEDTESVIDCALK